MLGIRANSHVCAGNHEELLAANGLYKQLVEKQLDPLTHPSGGADDASALGEPEAKKSQ